MRQSRDNIPGIEASWPVLVFLLPGMIWQWLNYMTVSGKVVRQRPSTNPIRPKPAYDVGVFSLLLVFAWLLDLGLKVDSGLFAIIAICCAFVGYFVFKEWLKLQEQKQAEEEEERLLQQWISKYGEVEGPRVLRNEVWQGMTSEQLLDSRGSPADIDRWVMKSKTKETWKYGQTGKNRFSERIFVEDNEVVGWEDK